MERPLFTTKPVLSERQLQTLELAGHGATYKQISLQLGIKQSCVRSRLLRIRYLLGVNSTARALVLCYKAGLIK